MSSAIRRLDAISLLIGAIVAVDLLGAVAKGGAESLTWLPVVAVLFFVPAALALRALSAFPAGGPYGWTRLAFGRAVGAMTALSYWVDASVWLGGAVAISALTVVSEFFVPVEGAARYAFALTFAWIVIAAAVMPVRARRWLATSGAVAQTLLLVVVTLTVAAYAARHGVEGLGMGGFARAVPALVGLAPLLVYSCIRFEAPAAFGDAGRRVPAVIGRAGLLTNPLFGLPTLAVMVVLPGDGATGLDGAVEALKSVFTVYGGHVAGDGTPVLSGAGNVLGSLGAAAFVWTLLTNGLIWITTAARGQAVALADGAGPRRLGDVPPLAILLSAGTVATATSLLAFAVAGADGDRYFALVVTISIALLAVANLTVFAALARLRVGARLVSGLAAAWCVFAVCAAVFPDLAAS